MLTPISYWVAVIYLYNLFTFIQSFTLKTHQLLGEYQSNVLKRTQSVRLNSSYVFCAFFVFFLLFFLKKGSWHNLNRNGRNLGCKWDIHTKPQKTEFKRSTNIKIYSFYLNSQVVTHTLWKQSLTVLFLCLIFTLFKSAWILQEEEEEDSIRS